jgi:Sigma-70 region 2
MCTASALPSQRQQVSIKVADYMEEYRTLKSVRPLAEPDLQTANSGQRADGHLTLPQYAELHNRHAAKMFRVAHRITRNREDAKDGVQECFLNAFIHLKTFDGRSRFRPG